MNNNEKKIILSQSFLMSMISTISGAVDRKSIHPGLSFALITLRENSISMVALDFEVQVEVTKTLPTEFRLNYCGSFCIPVKKVSDFIRALPVDEKISIVFDPQQGAKISLIAKNSRLEAAGFAAGDFPSFEAVECSPSFSIQATELKALLDSISFSMAHSDIRYYLNGMLWDLKDHALTCVATDGHRLALSTENVSVKPQDSQQTCIESYIVPRRTILELNKLLSSIEDYVHVSVGKSLVQIQVGDITLTSKLIDGKFPNYSRVIPKDNSAQLTLNKDKLKSALIQVQPIISQKNKGVELRFSSNILKIHAQNSQGEEVTVEVDIESNTEKEKALSLGLNIGYIYEYLQTVKEDSVNFFIKNSKAGVLLSHNSITKYLVMPLTL